MRASMSAEALADALRARAVPVLSSVASDGAIALLLPASSAACARLALASLAIPQVLQHSRDLRHAVVAVVSNSSPDTLLARVSAALTAAGLRAALAPVATTARSVAVVVPAAVRVAAVQALHAALAQAKPRVDVVVIGARGRVARALAQLLSDRGSRLPHAAGLDLRIVGAATREKLLWSDAGLAPATLAADVERSGAPSDRAGLLARILHTGARPRIVVDCTASEDIAALYPELLAAGIGVVTPNKRANARSWAFWRRLQELSRASGAPYRYSTTVGAGLPVLASARALRRRGDRLRSIEAVLSGSVSAILHAIQSGVPFSAAVADAQAKGFTEPHPAEDLSGEDVARKLLLVLREAGLPLERSAVQVDPLVGGELAHETDPAGFLAALTAVDAHWHARVITAQTKGEALVFVARYDGVRATVAVESRPAGDALTRLRAGENIAVLHTDHHDPLPLTLAGPGAGAELTAAGVLTDLIEAARDAATRARARRRRAKAARAA
jgi:aspartokinase/homoserine dehydrogenase 1